MIYFYASLGAAMLTGIMALFEVGLALTGQSLVHERSEFEVYRDIANSSDRLFQRMLTESQDLRVIGTGRYGSDLCQQILCRIQGINCRSGNTKSSLYVGLDYSDLADSRRILNYSTPGFAPAAGVWSSSCVLERWIDCDPVSDSLCGFAKFKHRVLIRPSRDRLYPGYELYSCIVERKAPDPRCLFERGA